MPELPEVETIRSGLSKKITGLKITKVEVKNLKTFQGNSDLIVGQKVLKVWRKAKVLGIDLVGPSGGSVGGVGSRSDVHARESNSLRSNRDSLRVNTSPSTAVTLLFHLKMTGQLILVGDRKQVTGNRFVGGHPTLDMLGELPNRSTRVIFTFDNKSTLYFNDQRKFGWVKVVETAKVKDEKFLNSLGPEPLEKEFTWQILKQNLLRHKSVAIKVAILDQTVVSGIGNIYACEACFLAKINPKKKVRELSDKEFQRLHQGIVEALTNGIKHGGSSRTHYVNVEGKKGRFLDFAFVYNREGEMCKVCGGRIGKIKLGGRGTFLCPRCQKSQD